MNIVIIGTGNVATVFGKLLVAANHSILQVFGRNPFHAKQLADELNTGHCSNWSDINREADIYLVAVSDNALYDLNQQLALPGKIVIHTAGSVSMEVLQSVSPNFGIIYPLQSLRKEMPVLTRIPLLINASNQQTRETVLAIASSISAYVTFTTDIQRLEYHVAAVFINNFTNHLYVLAENFCLQEGIDFKLLWPLTEETAERIKLVSPAQVMTGPAVRNDLITIQKHQELLAEYPILQHLYSELTSSIRQLQKPL